MRTKTLRNRKAWILLLLPVAFLSFKVAILFQPGLDSVEALAPFMNGNLPSSKPSEDIYLQEIHTDIPWESPQAILPFPGTDDLLVGEMDGRFYTIPDNDNATVSERTMVMDIQDRCWYYTYSGNTGQKHGGFQNVVFHPDFGQGLGKDYIYVYYLFKAENEDSDWNPPYYDRLSRFTWTGNSFDPDSELIMINQYDTTKGHDGSGLAFGNDGFLYISVGDEGTHSAESIPHTQLLNDRFRSGVWRIDVDMQGGTISHPIERQINNENTPANVEQSYTQGYYIPNDNPWVTGTGEFLEEFYATGLRQPFRMTYDPPTGNFWLGDVGASKWEEVNIMDKPGLNFQWNFKEGYVDGFRNSTNMPDPIYGEEREPLYAYDGSVGSAVIGGYVYRGSNIPGLYGKYIFGDNANGSVYALTHTGGNTHGGVEVISNVGGSVFNGISSLGYNHDNEIMVLKLSNGTPGGGKIFKIENNEGVGNGELPALLSQTGVFSDMQNLTPAPGVIPYDVNNPLWSSGTDKHRWVAIPQDGNVNSSDEQIGYSEEGAWTFPVGTTFIKHFNNPNGTKLETRLWVHGTDGEWFGSSYKWRANGMEADLILLGDNETITIDGDTFDYEYPASNTCVQCHNSSAGWVLGFSTRQLNKEIEYPSTGRFSNQLETLGSLGFIPVVDTNTVPTLVSIKDNNQPLETRVRSYFDSNCAYCHLPGNTRAGFDMRFSTPLSEQALIHGAIIEDETGSGKAIVPGDVAASNVHFRMSSLDPSTMMMPLAKGRVDTEALQLLEAWINSLNGNCDTENAGLLGSDNLTDGNFLDAHSPHININRTGAYTNNEEVAVSVCLDEFNFYASRVGNPVTPFVAKIEGENDFTVISIGQTRTSAEYTTGVNTFSFSDHSSDAVVLQPGESIAPGFMDAYPDGSGSLSGNSLIPAMTSGETDDIWQSYEANPDSDPHLVMGFIPQGNAIVQHLNRRYQFNIEINISAVNGELANPVVTLFQHVGYGGTSWELGVGEYPDITFKGISDNDASSIQVEEGYIVELYSEKDFGGDVFILEENDGNLVASNFNDQVSSIKIYAVAEPPGPSVATLFLDGAYSGAAYELEVGTYTDISLESIPLNQISSLQVSEGYVVELYPELNFGGTPIALTSGTSDLATLGIDDDTESIKVFVAPEGPAVATLFQHVSYGGTSWELAVGEYPDITIAGVTDNDASSVQVQEGYIVELYSETNFGGEVFILEESDANLVASNFNDQVSSVKIYALAEPPGPSMATFFQDGAFGGTSWGLDIGAYADISQESIPLNQISSVQVSDGYVVELYPELNFGGTPITLTSDTRDLNALGIDDETESIKIFEEIVEPTVATLFQHVSYGGTSWELAVGEYPDITIAGVTDNDASSVQVQEGYIVELYSETNFGGEVFILEESDANLVASNFNDQVSSVKIYALAEPPGPSMATLFQNGSYGGTSWGLGVGEYADLSLQSVPLNEISSVQVTEGYIVELYTELNFGGTALALSSDTSDLVALGIDDDVESIKVFADTTVTCDCQCASGEYSLLVNGSFEDTSNPAYATAYALIEDLGSANNGVKFIDAHTDSDFPGWFTTGGIALQQGGFSQGGTLELGQSGFLGIPAFNGNVFVEMDGNHHNQIISVTPGQLLDWELSHQGREGTDVISVSAGPVGDQTVIATLSSSNSDWVLHSGQYQVPAGVTEIQFTITPVEASDGDIDSSNLLDFVKVCPSPGTITTPTTVVTLYQDVAYGGVSWTLGFGEYADITLEGITDNDASSLQIEEGYIVELYSEKDFGGDVFILEEDDFNLVASNFNDMVSSVKIYAVAAPPEPTMATFYQDGSYGGTSWELQAGGYADISLQGIALNEIGSVQVEDGYVVELYPELNFGGTPIALTANTSDLIALGINDDAESIKIYVYEPEVTPVATLFQHGNYNGSSWDLGVGEYPDITLEGATDNDASSLQIQEGYVIELYSEKDFGGDMLTLEEDFPVLGNSSFDDMVSSVKIYAVAAPPEPTKATLYQEGAYGGTSWGLQAGDYADISLEGILLNEIGSVQVEGGYVVELYPELNFGGTPIALTSDTNELDALGMDDDTESIKIFVFEPEVNPVATIFEHGNYTGITWELEVGDYADITLEGILDNNASGLQILEGYVIELYSEKDFMGEMIKLDENSIFLGNYGFNDKTSSVRIYPLSEAPEPMVLSLFLDANYTGASWELGVGEYADVSLEGIPDNNVSGLQIESGFVVELYSEKDFGGAMLSLEENTSFLGNHGFNDMLSSIKIYESTEASGVFLKASIVPEEPISLYPNPVGDMFYLHSGKTTSEKANVYIYSSSGILVKQQKVVFDHTGDVIIYVDELASGLYTVLITNVNGQNTPIQIFKN